MQTGTFVLGWWLIAVDFAERGPTSRRCCHSAESDELSLAAAHAVSVPHVVWCSYCVGDVSTGHAYDVRRLCQYWTLHSRVVGAYWASHSTDRRTGSPDLKLGEDSCFDELRDHP
eukprot:492326-Rhodomonas_salina.6